ncbi:MAG: outer membrane protein assembly factor BamE [Rickettsiales bacterium]|nr:outer membrane protein assembly factor BamE [Rickettsiales bacterium]
MRKIAVLLPLMLAACLVKRYDKGVPMRESQVVEARAAKTKADVLKAMGSPGAITFAGDEKWFYGYARGSRFAFLDPSFESYRVLSFQFDAKDNVVSAGDSDIALAASAFSPDPAYTVSPVERERGYFEELFNNIGRYSMPGTAMQ